MIKIPLFLLFFTVTLYTSNAQNELRLGLNIGTAANDYFGDANIVLDVALSYLIPLSERLSVGPSAGLGLVLINGSDTYGLVPITASGRFRLNERLFAGADLGYSLILVDAVYGGFYYRPQLGYDFNSCSLVASYTGITQDSGGISFVGLGVEFKL